jgi:hypothetical protein
MGIVDSDKQKEKKLTKKHEALSARRENELNHNHTPHPLALQRSKYMCVDDSIEKNHVLMTNEKKAMNKEKKNDMDLNIRFIPEWEI